MLELLCCVHVLETECGTPGFYPSVVFTCLENPASHKDKLGQLFSESAEVRSLLRAF